MRARIIRGLNARAQMGQHGHLSENPLGLSLKGDARIEEWETDSDSVEKTDNPIDQSQFFIEE